MGKYTNVPMLTLPKWTREVNFGRAEPSLEGRTLGRLGIKRTVEHSEGDGQWRSICERCGGTGQIREDWAVPDEFGRKPGKPCFAECMNGLFVLPKPKHYKQACLMVCLHMERLNRHPEIKRVADSQIRYITTQTAAQTAGGWLVEILEFWKAIVQRYNRAMAGGAFISEEDKSSSLVERALRGYQVYLAHEEEIQTRKATGLSDWLVTLVYNVFRAEAAKGLKEEAYAEMNDGEKFFAQLKELEEDKDTLPNDQWRAAAMETFHAQKMDHDE